MLRVCFCFSSSVLVLLSVVLSMYSFACLMFVYLYLLVLCDMVFCHYIIYIYVDSVRSDTEISMSVT